MIRAAKADRNQKEVVAAFRKLGYSVLHIHQLKNCFDILVAKHDHVFCIEIKNGLLPPSKRQLTSGEKKFHDSWNAPVYIIESIDDVIKFDARCSI